MKTSQSHNSKFKASTRSHGKTVAEPSGNILPCKSLLAILAINVKIAVFLLCGSKILFYSGVLHPSPFLYMSVNVAP